MNKYWQILILVVLAVVVIFLIPAHRALAPAVTDFESCQKAGGTITDGEPVTCSFDNQTFPEQVSAQPEVVVDQPTYGALVSSPLTVTGRARGNWFFEANLPATLKDANGKVLAQKGMTATSDWMTVDFVPFAGTLEFTIPDTATGSLIISKDNPSGDPANNSSFAVPVRFK